MTERTRLLLSRRVGQSIRIGEDIEVVVTSITRGHVSLMVVAPADLPVDREEIYRRKQREGAKRSRSSKPEE